MCSMQAGVAACRRRPVGPRARRSAVCCLRRATSRRVHSVGQSVMHRPRDVEVDADLCPYPLRADTGLQGLVDAAVTKRREYVILGHRRRPQRPEMGGHQGAELGQTHDAQFTEPVVPGGHTGGCERQRAGQRRRATGDAGSVARRAGPADQAVARSITPQPAAARSRAPAPNCSRPRRRRVAASALLVGLLRCCLLGDVRATAGATGGLIDGACLLTGEFRVELLAQLLQPGRTGHVQS